MKPIDITIFGGQDDPCFGKHHELKSEECRRCGDSEICSIICGQKLHLTREKVEKKQPFKDLHEVNQTYLEYLEEWMQDEGDTRIELNLAAKLIQKQLIKDPKEPLDKIIREIREQISRVGKFKIVNNQNNKYIKLL